MEDNRNKILAIIITVVIMLGLVAGAYFFFYKKSPTTNTASQTSQSSLKKVSDDVVLSPTASFDHSAVWYFDSSGELFRRAFDNSTFEQYSKFPSEISNFRKAYWPAKGNDVILESSVNGQVTRNYFNESKGTFTKLPANIQGLDWMPDGVRIAYIWKSGDGKTQQLMVANADASGYRKVTDVFWPDMVVEVSPDGKNALLVRGQATDVNKVYMVDLQTGQFNTIIDIGKNIEVEWVSNNKFVYIQSAEGKNDVKIFDLQTNQAKDLSLNANLDKLTTDAAGKYLYVDYKNQTGKDVLNKIDLATYQLSQVYTFDATVVPHSLFMNDQIICFINSLDGKLYTLMP